MIKEIEVWQVQEWNALVHSFSNYDVFYLNEYVTAFMNESQKNGIPILLLYENGADKAINVVFKRDISKDDKLHGKIPEDTYFDLITPYGYGGFIGKIKNYDCLNKEYNEYCKQKKYICEFVRFELLNDYYNNYDGNILTKTHNVIRSLEMPIDLMWMDFKQNVRKNVKRANKNGLKIINENTGQYLKDFLDIYYSTMDRNSANNDYYFSKDFFKKINDMKDNIMYFHVVYENKIISTELVIYGAENCYSYLGGTYKDYFDLRPNEFLKFEIIKWAKDKGLTNFILGGGYGADDGIFHYKTHFSPRGIVNFYIGKKIFDNENYEKLVKVRSVDNPLCIDSEFFPQYRD